MVKFKDEQTHPSKVLAHTRTSEVAPSLSLQTNSRKKRKAAFITVDCSRNNAFQQLARAGAFGRSPGSGIRWILKLDWLSHGRFAATNLTPSDDVDVPELGQDVSRF